jgi:hypothetical protein
VQPFVDLHVGTLPSSTAGSQVLRPGFGLQRAILVPELSQNSCAPQVMGLYVLVGGTYLTVGAITVVVTVAVPASEAQIEDLHLDGSFLREEKALSGDMVVVGLLAEFLTVVMVMGPWRVLKLVGRELSLPPATAHGVTVLIAVEVTYSNCIPVEYTDWV